MAQLLTMTRMAASNASDRAQSMKSAAQAQSSQALIVQAYSLSALKQNPIDLAGFTNLAPLVTQVNTTIANSQAHAKSYLDVILPGAIQTITNIDSYFNLQNALPLAITPSTDAKTAVAMLKAAQQQAQTFQSQSAGIVTQFQQLRTNLSADSAAFASLVNKLNDAVNGDNGTLADIDSQLGTIDGKISGCIAGTVLSGLAIFGGIFMICVGAIADFVTAGTTTPLVVAGIGVVAAGVGGEVASAVTLANLIKTKNSLLTQKSQLTSEVNLALGMKSGFQSLADSSSAAATASQQMANAWSALQGDLGNLAGQLEQGQTTVDAVRLLFQTAAQGSVKSVQEDIQTIKQQLAGTQQVDQPATASIADTIVAVAQKVQKAAA